MENRYSSETLCLWGKIFLVDRSIKIGTHEGTSPCNKSRGQVPACELAIFASKSSHRDQALVPATSPTNSNQFEFLGQAAATCSSKRCVSCSLDKSPRPVPMCKLFRGLVAGTNRMY